MKRFQYLIIFSLFSILVSGCITVPRIQKKDAKNNQFSNQIKNWFYVAHPQQIDTTIRIISDTTYDTTYNYNKSDEYRFNNSIYINGKLQSDTLYIDSNNQVIYNLPNTWDNGDISYNDSLHFDTLTFSSKLGEEHWANINLKSDTIYIRRTIHDSVIVTKVDQSAINAYQNQLQASRDSLNTYMIKYANKDSQSSKRLTLIIILCVALGLSGFFNIKNIFKL